MWNKFLAWWKEINQACSIMDAYVDDHIAVIEPGKLRSNPARRKAWTTAANWAFTQVRDL